MGFFKTKLSKPKEDTKEEAAVEQAESLVTETAGQDGQSVAQPKKKSFNFKSVITVVVLAALTFVSGLAAYYFLLMPLGGSGKQAGLKPLIKPPLTALTSPVSPIQPQGAATAPQAPSVAPVAPAATPPAAPVAPVTQGKQAVPIQPQVRAESVQAGRSTEVRKNEARPDANLGLSDENPFKKKFYDKLARNKSCDDDVVKSREKEVDRLMKELQTKPAEPVQAKMPEPPKPELKIKVSGTIIGKEKIAFTDKGTLTVGSNVEGYVITDITRDSVVVGANSYLISGSGTH